MAEFVADHGEPQDAAFEPVGESSEERSFLLVFEEVELADDEVALFAGVNQLGQAGMTAAAMTPRVYRLGVHAGDEKA